MGTEAVVPKPAALSFEQAGGLLLVGTTTVHAVRAVGVSEGETLLVHGASGGVDERRFRWRGRVART